MTERRQAQEPLEEDRCRHLPDTLSLARPVSGRDEASRLAALRATQLLDSAPEQSFDRLTALACRLLGAPVSLISLVDAQRQFFKTQYGFQGAT